MTANSRDCKCGAAVRPIVWLYFSCSCECVNDCVAGSFVYIKTNLISKQTFLTVRSLFDNLVCPVLVDGSQAHRVGKQKLSQNRWVC